MSFSSSSFFCPPGPPMQSNAKFQSLNVNGLKVSVMDGTANLTSSENAQLSGGTNVSLKSGNNLYVMPVITGTAGQFLQINTVVVVDDVNVHNLIWADIN